MFQPYTKGRRICSLQSTGMLNKPHTTSKCRSTIQPCWWNQIGGRFRNAYMPPIATSHSAERVSFDHTEQKLWHHDEQTPHQCGNTRELSKSKEEHLRSRLLVLCSFQNSEFSDLPCWTSSYWFRAMTNSAGSGESKTPISFSVWGGCNSLPA